MINEKEKFIFLHIPKTGGTSINDAVMKELGTRTTNFRHYNLRRHGLLKEEADQYTIFSVIRNPFDRVVSSYEHFLISAYGGCEKTYPFYEYVRNIDRYFEGELEVNTDYSKNKTRLLYRALDKQGRILLDSQHIEKLSWWTETTDGKQAHCNFLRFENLNNQWNIFKSNIGIKSGATLEKLNISKKTIIGRSYLKYYQRIETRDIIEHHYREEIERFDYRFFWLQKPCIFTPILSRRALSPLPKPTKKQTPPQQKRIGPIYTGYIEEKRPYRGKGFFAKFFGMLIDFFKGKK